LTLTLQNKKRRGKKKTAPKGQIPQAIFDVTENCELRKLAPNGYVKFWKDFMTEKSSQNLFDLIESKVVWNQPDIVLYGKKIKTPRLQFWLATSLLVTPSLYQKTLPMLFSDFPEILDIKNRIEGKLNFTFDYVLLNKYRDGKDYIAFHSDAEHTEPGKNVIASVSLGQQRRFLVRSKDKDSETPVIEYELTSGSLVVMGGDMQQYWKHSVPKELRVKNPRLNLTFRKS